MVFGKSSIIERVARGWLSVVGVSQCVNRGRQQLAVSGDQSGRSDLLKRQTDGGYPSCVRRMRQGDAGEVELGCYVLCGCTKGRQCESTVALRRRRFVAAVAIWSAGPLCGSRSTARPSARLPNTAFVLALEVEPINFHFFFASLLPGGGGAVLSVSVRTWPTRTDGRMRGHGMHAE